MRSEGAAGNGPAVTDIGPAAYGVEDDPLAGGGVSLVSVFTNTCGFAFGAAPPAGPDLDVAAPAGSVSSGSSLFYFSKFLPAISGLPPWWPLCGRLFKF